MSEMSIGKITGLVYGACPVCGNDDLFWERTPVHHELLADDRRSWWPDESSSWEPIGDALLECGKCGLQFKTEVLVSGDWEDIEVE